ncbi:DUF6544 family protein [Geodermatophilus sp. SYSU D00758]
MIAHPRTSPDRPRSGTARAARRDRARLAGITTRGDRFDPDAVADLPEPARRLLRHAVAPGTPLWRSAELRMRGRIRIGAWRPFTARQVLAPPTGFVWAATARFAGLPVTGFDRLTDGTGELRWKLLGLLPVLTATGPDVTRSAAGRLAGEGLCWLPTAYPDVVWSAGEGPDTVTATYRIGHRYTGGDRTGDDGTGEEVAHLRVGPDGGLRELVLQRWGDPGGRPAGRYPFGVAVEAERTWQGVTVPSVVRAGWDRGTDRQAEGEFFRAEITDVTFR